MKSPCMLAVAIFFTTIGSCGGIDEIDTLSQEAIVSDSQKDQAFDIIQQMEEIGYIPFTHKQTGCSARALYMAAELAAQRIPSSSFYLFGELHPTEDIIWKSGHVAPLIKLAGDHQAYILDPALANQPTTLMEWIDLNNPKNGEYSYYLSQGSYYAASTSSRVPTLFLLVMLGAHFGLLPDLEKRPLEDERLIDSFDKLQKFRRSDMLGACGWMHDNWKLAADKDENIDLQQKRSLLISRTQHLLERLYEEGKLDRAPVTLSGKCKIQR